MSDLREQCVFHAPEGVSSEVLTHVHEFEGREDGLLERIRGVLGVDTY